jgi:hypothetical protein
MEAPKRLNYPYLITRDTSPSRENLEVSMQALQSRRVSSASKHLGASDQGGQTAPLGR